jgi:mono/diheme cytochrome c family protein
MRTVFKWIGILLGSLIGLLVIGYVIMTLQVQQKLNTVYDVPAETVPVSTDPEVIARGQHVVATIAFCDDCHGPNLSGQIMSDDIAVGRLVAPNLTAGQGGLGDELTDEDFVRAIRHGVDTDGTPLLIMPANLYYELTDADLGAVISYIKSLPPTDNVLPGTQPGPVGNFFILTDPLSLTAGLIDHDAPRPPDVQPGVTVEYGEYLAISCSTCHGENMQGGEFEGAGGNLTMGGNLADWTEADFINTVRTQITPEGHQIDPEMAPVFDRIDQMSDDELKAIWLYLNSLPPVESPQTPGASSAP